jgi:hypothetical protein
MAIEIVKNPSATLDAKHAESEKQYGGATRVAFDNAGNVYVSERMKSGQWTPWKKRQR